TLVWLDGADRVEAEAERFGRLAWERHQAAKEERQLIAPLDALYLNEHEWRAALEPFAQVHGESLTGLERSHQSTFTLESFLTSDVRLETALHGKEASLAPLVERLKSWQGQKVIFVAPTRADATRLTELLGNYNLSVPVVETAFSAVLAR